MTKINIVVPVYNASMHLRGCLNSLKNQTLNDINFWLVNDGSTDNSLEICESYATVDSRFHVINQKNAGAGAARDVGITKCDGEYVGFLDSDDWVENNAYENMYVTAKKHDADIVRCNTTIHKGEHIETRWNPPFCNQVIENSSIINDVIPLLIAPKEERKFDERLLRGCVCNIFRRSIINDNNIHFTHLKSGEDVLFTIEAMLLAKKMVILPEAYYHYMFDNTDSLSKSVNSIDLKQRDDLRNQMKNLLAHTTCYEEIKNRWEQEDRRLVYLDIRIIVVYAKELSKHDRIVKLRKLLNSEQCKLAFKEKIDRRLPIQMYILYSLIQMKMPKALFFIVKLKFRGEV